MKSTVSSYSIHAQLILLTGVYDFCRTLRWFMNKSGHSQLSSKFLNQRAFARFFLNQKLHDTLLTSGELWLWCSVGSCIEGNAK